MTLPLVLIISVLLPIIVLFSNDTSAELMYIALAELLAKLFSNLVSSIFASPLYNITAPAELPALLSLNSDLLIFKLPSSLV